ncbi:107-domain-containing protein [Suillus subluteus]|nr:107-domain-containing protein [Suillus subluteus]
MGSSIIQPRCCSIEGDRRSLVVKVLSVCQTAKDDLTALLSPIWDLGQDYDNCVVTEAEDSASSDVSQEELDISRMEANEPGLHQVVIPLGQKPGGFTHSLRNQRGSGKELDADAMNRSYAQLLAADDAGSEKILAQALYSFVRAGRLDDAVELCRKTRQPWRAASIRANEKRDDDGIDDAEDAKGWQGNPRRKLWKSICARAALNPNLSDPKRILYVALAPCLQTFSCLQICMSNMGRPSVGAGQYPMRGETDRRDD